MATRGFNYGVDFVGGRTYVVRFDDKNVTTEDVRPIVNKYLGKAITRLKPSVTDISVTTKYLINDSAANADDKVQAALIKALDTKPANTYYSANIISSAKSCANYSKRVKKIGCINCDFCHHHYFGLYTYPVP